MVSIKDGKVEFSFYRPRAKHVELMGDFNGWHMGQLHMAENDAGYWKAWLKLPPGTYRFCYVADGKRYVDYAAFGIEFGPYGPNAICFVPSSSTEGGYRTANNKRPSAVARSNNINRKGA